MSWIRQEETCDDERLESVFRHLERVIVAHLVESSAIKRRKTTLRAINLLYRRWRTSQKRNTIANRSANCSMRALVTERVPLTEPNAIYETFRSDGNGSKASRRSLKTSGGFQKVQSRLWGNDDKHAYVLLSSSLEAVSRWRYANG